MPADETTHDPLAAFHPAIAEWFRRRFPDGPTEAQMRGWEAIAGGHDTLIAAPTGSGKTLAGFLVAIDRCFRTATAPARPPLPAAQGAGAADGRLGRDPGSDGESPGTQVVYVSPLRALTVDIAENLERPLEEIRQIGEELGVELPPVRVSVRNGDTPPSARAAMLRHPPEIVVTTPESLYLFVTSPRGRAMLANVGTVIVDEIHALARDKRGSHLSLTLERLDHCVDGPRPVRIGLSATQRPIESVARLLVGAGDAGGSGTDGSVDDSVGEAKPRCRIVDSGHRRRLDLSIELPGSELGAVATSEQLAEILEMIATEVATRRTTLVFVNTRRMAERIAHLLGERLGADLVSAHHGSLSTDRRLRVESRLRAGDLRALVATASLELGIDVGPVDLVCQLGSPRSIATFLQRVGRSQHRLQGTPTGRLYPLTRDELVEGTALLAAVAAGELDIVEPPVAPLDILAQQIVAECAGSGEEWPEDELFGLVRRAAPYAALDRRDFDDVVELMHQGVTTGRGRRGAHLHRDRTNGVLRARRGARITALTSGGAIPEVADYRVVLEPEDTLVGTVNEDWAIESMAGDVFLLGTNSWRIRRVEPGTVRVVDAAGAPPTVPFWLGEAPARTNELSAAVSSLRRGVDERLGEPGSDGRAAGVEAARRFVQESAGVSARAADEVVAYLAAAQAALGTLPTIDRLVFERFFDDTGGTQLVLHAPFGARINRALGLALRKRFCRSFDFELQAAASDDAVLLSLAPHHSFPLEDVTSYLSPAGLESTLTQAVLATPIFTARWRWNLTRSLVAPRARGGRKVPPAIQRMEADDLMAAVFPALAGCQENATGPIELPDHPIVRQTVRDCMTEAMDLERVTSVLEGVRAGTIATRFVETAEPSLLSHEIVNGRPYTFLDGAPLEERRSRAVQLRRGIPLEEHSFSALDSDVLAQVCRDAAPEPRDAEELHDLLCTLVVMEPDLRFEDDFKSLVAKRRAMTISLAPGEPEGQQVLRWCALDRRPEVEMLWPQAAFTPDLEIPASLASLPPPEPDEAVTSVVRAHLDVSPPVTAADISRAAGLRTPAVRSALARLEHEGTAMRVPGQAGDGVAAGAGGTPDSDVAGAGGTPDSDVAGASDTTGERYCARRLLARAFGASRDQRRRGIEAVSAQTLVRFLLEWQHVAPGTALQGPGGLAEVVEQLQGFEAPIGAFEESILPKRVGGYQASLLDGLCLSGEVSWGRLTPRPGDARDNGDAVPARRRGAAPSRSTPVSLLRRDDLVWLLRAVRGDAQPVEASVGAAQEVVEALRARGALFFHDLCTLTGRLPGDVAEAVWDGVARGLVTADGFQAVRSLLSGRYRASGGGNGAGRAGAAGRGSRFLRPGSRRPGVPARSLRPALSGGRWSLIHAPADAEMDADELAEAVAGQLLLRWGVVVRELMARESFSLPWRDVLFALRRFEARGVALGGRFVAGFAGEQFALPEAAEHMRSVQRRKPDGTLVTLSAADPLNIAGILTAGPRIPALRQSRIELLDGVPVTEDAAGTPPRQRVLEHAPGS